MDFSLFSQRIPKIKDLPLPGESAHLKMAPEIRAKLMKERGQRLENAKKAGVMALFYPDFQENTNLLLILRKTYRGVHSNQIAFPGGKVEDDDADLIQTALRETHEEVGVPPHKVEIIKPLSTVYIPPSNFEVQPYVGLLTESVSFTLQETEVASLVEVPLSDFMDDNKIFIQKQSTSYAVDIDVPAFDLNGHTVWGATAMMMSEIKELLKKVL